MEAGGYCRSNSRRFRVREGLRIGGKEIGLRGESILYLTCGGDGWIQPESLQEETAVVCSILTSYCRWCRGARSQGHGGRGRWPSPSSTTESGGGRRRPSRCCAAPGVMVMCGLLRERRGGRAAVQRLSAASAPLVTARWTAQGGG